MSKTNTAREDSTLAQLETTIGETIALACNALGNISQKRKVKFARRVVEMLRSGAADLEAEIPTVK